jgi:UDP-2-acetamido-2,6-beta-L-arabino-hexul-4-ose reductase
MDVKEFAEGNADLTAELCDFINCRNRTQDSADHLVVGPGRPRITRTERASVVPRWLRCNAGGKYGQPGVPSTGCPGVFGKWCRPNYNSVVATFCHNIANDLPIQISDHGLRP